MKNLIMLFISLLLFQSCATWREGLSYEDLKPEAQTVYIQFGGFVSKGCTKLKELSVSQQKTMFKSEKEVFTGAQHKLKNRTQESLGNVAIVAETGKYMIPGWNPFSANVLSVLSYKAIVFSCPEDSVIAMKNNDPSKGGTTITHKEAVTEDATIY